MKGFDEFLSVFGNITVSQIVIVIVACIFIIVAYKKFRDYLIKKHEIEEVRDVQLNEALEAARKYPEWRQESIKIQQSLEDEIQELRILQKENTDRLTKMEEQNDRRERNKLRDRLLQSYRYYTNKEANPSQTWTRMEAEAFWELFKDYEDAGGNGYIHTVVQPAMECLTIVEIGK